MKRTILICGYGPGISDSVAKRFGQEDYSVALVARTEAQLAEGVESLAHGGTSAKAFQHDLSNPATISQLIQRVREEVGPISVLHWNAYTHAAGNLSTSTTAELSGVFDLLIHSLVAAVQAALPDLKREKGAVLVTGGGFALYDSKIDALAVQWDSMGLAVAKAAQHKLVGVLHQQLSLEDVYVGEVTVMGLVKNVLAAHGDSGIEPADIADAFYRIYKERKEVWVSIS